MIECLPKQTYHFQYFDQGLLHPQEVHHRDKIPTPTLRSQPPNKDKEQLLPAL
jgi:hypothetical protein